MYSSFASDKHIANGPHTEKQALLQQNDQPKFSTASENL